MGETTDPYEAFEVWASANGFSDVIECKPEDIDLSRLHEAITSYANFG